jgi:hypothetical protein
MKHINVMPVGLPINSPAAMPALFAEGALTRLPMLPNSRIGELLPHHWILADYSLPSWEGQVQTEHPDKDEGDEPQTQER